jgi:regulatory protein
MRPGNYKILLGKALKYLGYRNRSEQEMRIYLAKYTGSSETNDQIDRVITQLYKLNLLNDVKFAREMTQSQINRGKGPRFITLKLKQAGVSQESIDVVLNETSEDEWKAGAFDQISKKLPQFNKLNKWQLRSKVYQYLSQRGFDARTINTVIDEISNKGLK